MNVLAMLEEVLAERAADWTPEDRNLARVVGRDWIELQARQARGYDVEAELRVVSTSAQQIAAGAQVTGAAVLGDWLTRLAAAGARFFLGGGA